MLRKHLFRTILIVVVIARAVYALVPNWQLDNLKKQQLEILSQLSNLSDIPVPDLSRAVTLEELNDSKANFIGRLPLALESNAGVAAAILNLERYDLGLDYYRGYTSMIEGVTAQQILDTAQKFLHPDRLGIAVAGP